MDFTPKRKKTDVEIDQDLLKQYPHDLQLYELPPTGEIKLETFEQIALERQKVLQTIESVSTQSDLKTIKEFKNALTIALKRENLNNYAKLVNSPGISNNPDLLLRQRDHISHFILRLVYCSTEDLRIFFLKFEVDLFKYRFHSLIECKEGMRQFLEIVGFDYQPISQEEKDEKREELVDSSREMSDFESSHFYKIPYEKVLDLVSERKVYVNQGIAYVPESELLSVFVNNFRHQLMTGLMKTEEFLRDVYDERILRMVKSLPNSFDGMDRVVWSENVSVENIDNLSKTSFPLCMRILHEDLKKHHKLRHHGRQQYGLYLKGIGVSMEDSLQFWKNEFLKNPEINEDKFAKSYAYNIRHNYGKEGKQTNYTPMGCTKIINSSVGPGENHGCPFKHMDKEELHKRLVEYKVSHGEATDIIKLSSAGHYGLACKKYFEVMHKESPSTAILHPNAYFNESRTLLTKNLNPNTEEETKDNNYSTVTNTPDRTIQTPKVKVESESVTPIRSVDPKPKKLDTKPSFKKEPLNIEALLMEDDSD